MTRPDPEVEDGVDDDDEDLADLIAEIPPWPRDPLAQLGDVLARRHLQRRLTGEDRIFVSWMFLRVR